MYILPGATNFFNLAIPLAQEVVFQGRTIAEAAALVAGDAIARLLQYV